MLTDATLRTNKAEILQREYINLVNGGVSPDEILRKAILYKAAAIVVCHNHPSDRVEPSQADLQLTSNLKRACSVMSIPLLDHIIVGKDSYYSFRENGVL